MGEQEKLQALEHSAEKAADLPQPTAASPEPEASWPAPNTARATAFAVAGWFVPGLGHAFLRMWGRAVICFVTVGILCFAGARMRGNIFASDSADPFATLGFMADLGAGAFYPLSKIVETHGPDVSHADGDYGTRLLATAGVLNLLFALHAYEAARGRKA